MKIKITFEKYIIIIVSGRIYVDYIKITFFFSYSKFLLFANIYFKHYILSINDNSNSNILISNFNIIIDYFHIFNLFINELSFTFLLIHSFL